MFDIISCLTLAILVFVFMDLVMVLVYISGTTNVIEPIFVWLFAVCVCSFLKCLYVTFIYFPIG